MHSDDQYSMNVFGKQNNTYILIKNLKLKIERYWITQLFWFQVFNICNIVWSLKHAKFLEKCGLLLISIENLVIFVVWLLSNCLVNVAETFTDIL